MANAPDFQPNYGLTQWPVPGPREAGSCGGTPRPVKQPTRPALARCLRLTTGAAAPSSRWFPALRGSGALRRRPTVDRHGSRRTGRRPPRPARPPRSRLEEAAEAASAETCRYPTGRVDFAEREDGGAEGSRTPDLRIANATLSQLSYGPGAAAGDPRAGRKAAGSCCGPPSLSSNARPWRAPLVPAPAPSALPPARHLRHDPGLAPKGAALISAEGRGTDKRRKARHR